MYNINYKILRKNVGFYMVFFVIGVGLFIFEAFFMFGIENIISPALIFLALPISFMVMGGINLSKQFKRIKQVKQLNEVGVLYKNVPYVLERTGMKVNNVRLKKPVVTFNLPGGVPIRLEGDPRHDTAYIQKTGFIDVIIDPSDTSISYIDFNINRIGGNRPSDYYTQPNQQQTNLQSPMSTEIKPL